VRLRKLTSDVLAEALADLTTNARYRLAAQSVSETLALESGTEKAIKVIERVMAGYVPRVNKKRA